MGWSVFSIINFLWLALRQILLFIEITFYNGSGSKKYVFIAVKRIHSHYNLLLLVVSVARFLFFYDMSKHSQHLCWRQQIDHKIFFKVQNVTYMFVNWALDNLAVAHLKSSQTSNNKNKPKWPMGQWMQQSSAINIEFSMFLVNFKLQLKETWIINSGH